MNPNFSMPQQQLKEIAVTCADKIANAAEGVNFFEEPFKHCVIDNFLPAVLAEACLENFPGLKDPIWHHSNDADVEVKMRTTWQSEFDIPPGILEAVRILNSAPVLKALSTRLGIPKLLPDPYFTGGGLNATIRGGLLDVHVDGNYHDATGLNRRINAIVYLNKNWQQNWGGEFGLYDKTGENCLKEVAPLFNRLVVFDTHDYSFHGLPNPLNFPENDSRKSIILYYYTKEARPSSQIVVNEPHSALWKKRGLKDKQGNTTRSFE
jgi:Rps23 Pro-64 3,4-dihydroxylase Tpa1-like proline 4-hydroxylase